MPTPHAVCITGLERSFPEIALNIRAALTTLYTTPPTQQLADTVSFFGVRPANDSWSAVRETLPPLAAESLQTPCGYHPPPWFSAYARTLAAKIGFAFSFVQSMCDMADCMQLIKEHEANARGGLKFETLARLRLDLAWEAPLYWPPSGLVPNAVHTPRMNTKAGINDKWALGYRDAMEVYLTRLHAIAAANVLYTKHQQFANHSLLKHNHSSGGLLPYEKSEIKRMISFKCRGRSGGGIQCDPEFIGRPFAWQGTLPVLAAVPHTRNATASAVHTDKHAGLVSPHTFTLTSESFLQWSLWRRNVTVAYEPSWMFCKFKDAMTAGNNSVRICVPRMRRKKPCLALTCTGSGVDCACRNETCTHWDPHLRKNATHWYCQDSGGKQLGLDGELY